MSTVKAAVAVLVLVASALATSNVSTSVAAAQEAPANEVGCNTFDATGDTQDLGTANPRPEPRADITRLCVSYAYALRVVVVVAQRTDPASDPGWGASGDSRVDIGIDTDADPDLEFSVSANGEDLALVRDESTGRAVCVAPFFALATGYAIEVSRNCLGADTVAVSAVMVYDPAPAPTTGPLVGDFAPDTGFVPQVTRAAPPVPQPLADAAAPVCTIDEVNDTFDEAARPVEFDAADIVETCMQHGAAELRLTARMRRATDPQTDPIWRARSGVAWDLDANNDLAEDFNVIFTDTGARVYASDASDAADFCAGTPGFDGTWLIVHLPRVCLGNPPYVAARPYAVFARLAQIEPEPPLAIDPFRFPGYSVLVGAPGATVPQQATLPSSGSPANPEPPGRAVIPASSGTGSTGTGGTTARTGSSGTSAGAGVTRTSTRTATLAATGAVVDPALWAVAMVGFGLLLVLGSRRRMALEPAGQWDLLPSRRSAFPRWRRSRG